MVTSAYTTNQIFFGNGSKTENLSAYSVIWNGHTFQILLPHLFSYTSTELYVISIACQTATQEIQSIFIFTDSVLAIQNFNHNCCSLHSLVITILHNIENKSLNATVLLVPEHRSSSLSVQADISYQIGTIFSQPIIKILWNYLDAHLRSNIYNEWFQRWRQKSSFLFTGI